MISTLMKDLFVILALSIDHQPLIYVIPSSEGDLLYKLEQFDKQEIDYFDQSKYSDDQKEIIRLL